MESFYDALDDLQRLDDVLAVMLVKSPGKIYQSRVPARIKNVSLLTLIKGTMDTFLSVMSKFHDYGMDNITVDLGKISVLLYSVDRGTALVTVINSLSNRGLIEVEVENTRCRIKGLMRNRLAQ